MVKKSYVWNSILKNKDRTIYQALKSIKLFNGYTNRELKAIERIGHIRSFDSEEVVFYKDEPSYGFYILLEGQVDISVKKTHIITFKPFDLFGQFSMVDGNKRTATAVAKEQSKLFYIYSHHLKELFKENPKMGFSFYEQLLSMLSKLIEKYDENLCSDKCSIKK